MNYNTTALKKLVFQRDRRTNIISKFPIGSNWTSYMKFRNKVNIEIKTAKIQYYNSCFFFKETLETLSMFGDREINGLMGNESRSTK